jgi:hypothetical protein
MNTELAGWLAELVHQQHHRSPEVTEEELKASWDRFLDNLNAARAQGETMTTIDHPAGGHIGHIPLNSGEVITISIIGGQVVIALFASTPRPATGPRSCWKRWTAAVAAFRSADGDTVTPAPVIALDASEAETVSGLIGYAAVNVLGRRRRLRPVTEDGEHDVR